MHRTPIQHGALWRVHSAPIRFYVPIAFSAKAYLTDQGRAGRSHRPGKRNDQGRGGPSMQHEEDHGLDFIEGFSLLAGAIWVIGAVLLVAMAMLGQGRV
jgi:hypothetical protein